MITTEDTEDTEKANAWLMFFSVPSVFSVVNVFQFRFEVSDG
jgi:hypothetical protein